MNNRNHKFFVTRDWEFDSKPATEQELKKAREEAKEIIKKGGE